MKNKKLIALILAMTMTISIAGTPIVSAETSTQEGTSAPIETITPEETSTPELTATPEATDIPLPEGIYYAEDFESDAVAENITNQANGWTNGGDEQKYFGVIGSSIGNSTRFYRQAVTDWWKSDISNLNLYDNGVYKLVTNGAEQTAAETQVREYLSKNLSISFKANFAAPNPKDFGEDYIRIKDESGNTLIGISAKQDQRIETDEGDLSTGKIVLTHIMNDDMTASTEETLLSGLNIAEHNQNWYNFTVDIDAENKQVRVSINGSEGEWMPIGNSDKTGAAESIGMIKEFEFGIWAGAWWQSLYIDDISVTDMTVDSEKETPAPSPEETDTPTETSTPEPTATPEATYIPLPEGTYYAEDFESDAVAENITNQANGWTNGGDEQKYFGVIGSSMGNNTQFYRQAVTDWWKSDISNLNLYDNGVYKLVTNGAEQAAAETQVREYLSKNLSISFKANFAAPNPKDFGEDYIRIKDESGNTLIGISAKQDQRIETEEGDLSTGKIVLTHIMNDDMTASTEETLLSGLNISENNQNWYNFTVDIDAENKQVRVNVNGNKGEWMPIGNSDKTGAAESIGMIKEIEFGIWSGAWWQSLYIDDVSVTDMTVDSENDVEITGARILNSDNSPVIYAGDSVHSKITATEGAEVTVVMSYSTDSGATYSGLEENGIVPEGADKLKIEATAQMNGNSVTKTAYVNVGEDDNTIENVDFSNRVQIQEWAIAGKNGWSSYGNDNTQIQASDDHDGSFRLANSNFFEQSWIEHSFVDVEKSRLINEGATEAEASAEALRRLENNPTVSLDVRFDNRHGNDKSVNCAHVRVYDVDGKVIGALYNENQKDDSGAFTYDKLYLISLNAAGDALEKTFIADVDVDKLYNVKFEFNNDTNKMRVSVDGNVITTPQGEWTDVASASCGDDGSIGAAQPYDFGAVAKLQIGIWWTNWWQSVYFDNIRVAPAEYDINSSITGGTATYTHGKKAAQTAAGGNRVTMTLTNDSSSKPGAKNVSVKTQSNADVEVTALGNDKYTFVMPREAVTVAAEFENDQTVETPSPSPEATDKPEETDIPEETSTPEPTATPEATDVPLPEGTYYAEDFESDAVTENITNQANGWSYDGNSDDSGAHTDKLNLWVGDNGSGSDNSLRFASTDWYKTMWLNIDLKANGISKYVDAGYDAALAEETVTEYLSNDMSLSFKVKFENQGIDSNSTHEQYIRVKGDRYNVITELRLKDDILYLNAMNEDKTQDMLYQIERVDISSQNNQWHTVTININKEDNTYSLIFDGTTFGGTPWGENIPAGIASDEDRSIGSVATMEFGHFWSGWWQCMYLDDITIGEVQETPPVINPEWGVKEFDIEAETGEFTLTVSAGDMRYADTVIYAALYKDGALESVKAFNEPEFNEESLFTAVDSFTIPEDKENLSVKVFIWRGGMRPILETPYEKALSL